MAGMITAMMARQHKHRLHSHILTPLERLGPQFLLCYLPDAGQASTRQRPDKPQLDGRTLVSYTPDVGGFFSVKVAKGVRLSASSRGLRAHVGPRGARLHVGGGGTGMSTGAGPVTYYSSFSSGTKGGVAPRRAGGPTNTQIAQAERSDSSSSYGTYSQRS